MKFHVINFMKSKIRNYTTRKLPKPKHQNASKTYQRLIFSVNLLQIKFKNLRSQTKQQDPHHISSDLMQRYQNTPKISTNLNPRDKNMKPTFVKQTEKLSQRELGNNDRKRQILEAGSNYFWRNLSSTTAEISRRGFPMPRRMPSDAICARRTVVAVKSNTDISRICLADGKLESRQYL